MDDDLLMMPVPPINRTLIMIAPVYVMRSMISQILVSHSAHRSLEVSLN